MLIFVEMILIELWNIKFEIFCLIDAKGGIFFLDFAEPRRFKGTGVMIYARGKNLYCYFLSHLVPN